MDLFKNLFFTILPLGFESYKWCVMKIALNDRWRVRPTICHVMCERYSIDD